MPKILVLTDDIALFRRLCRTLNDPGYGLRQVEGWRELRARTRLDGSDLVLVDARHPDSEGCLLAARDGRAGRTPVLLLGGAGGGGLAPEARWAAGMRLDAGAARGPLREAVCTLLARDREWVEVVRYEADGLCLDFVEGTFSRFGKPLPLSEVEQRLLRLLLQFSGLTLSRERIVSRVWGRPVDANTLSVTVSRLRGLVEEDAVRPAHLLTVYGGGYQWRDAGAPLAQSGRVGYNGKSLSEKGR